MPGFNTSTRVVYISSQCCSDFNYVSPCSIFVSEFLDANDPSLAFAVYGASQLNIFPIAVLDVTTAGSSKKELLLCFNGKCFFFLFEHSFVFFYGFTDVYRHADSLRRFC